MTKQDFENALKIKKEILELKAVEDAGFQINNQYLKSLERQLTGLKKQFDVAARNMEHEVAMVLYLHYLQAWPYRMIQKYQYGCRYTESHPRKIANRFLEANN